MTREWVEELFEEEFAKLERFDGDRFRDAHEIFEEVALAPEFPTFLTLPAYARCLCETAGKEDEYEAGLPEPERALATV